MSGFPISGEAAEAFEAVFYNEFPQDAPRPLYDALRAFLEAEKFEIEELPQCGCGVHAGWTEQRLVSPWRTKEDA